MIAPLLLTATLMIETNVPKFVPGDKVIWGSNNNCKGIVLTVNQKLVTVKGMCTVGGINFAVSDYLNINDVTKE